MSRILVTGSADGLGRLVAESLVAAGHEVLVHARNEERATALVPLRDNGALVLVGDLSDRTDIQRIVAELEAADPVDAVIHNAGVHSGPAVMPVNVVAPYLLTASLSAPQRHVYLSSGAHHRGVASVEHIDWRGNAPGSYPDSKLLLTTLARAVARIRSDVLSNSVDPGWVPTRMGGPRATDDLELGYRTQEWLATSEDPRALTSGGHWFHCRPSETHEAVRDEAFQDRLLAALAGETGIQL